MERQWRRIIVRYAGPRSKAEFIAKMGMVVEEADEAILCLELMTESGIVSQAKTEALLKEANELTAIFAASQRTARSAA
jgi:four helix bundle protein